VYSKIDEAFWRDDKIPSLTDDAKLLFLYMLTNPHRNLLGLYLLPVPYGSYDLGWTEKRVESGMLELGKMEIVMRDKKWSIIYVPNYLKYNPLENRNQCIAGVRALNVIPRTSMDKLLLERLESMEKPYMVDLISELQSRIHKTSGVPVHDDQQEMPIPEQHTLDVRAIDECFERLWTLYPNKQGKVAVKMAAKRRVYEYGETRIVAAITAYNKDLSENTWKHPMNGSTWFNGRYEDYDKPISEKKDPLMSYEVM